MKIKTMSLGVLFLLGLSVVGCEKKDRLTGNTFNATISPQAAEVIKGSSLTLSLRTSSQGVSPETSATWTLSNANGSVNTTFGPSVVFSGDQLGDVEVTATLEGQTATAQIAVVSHIPGGSSFDVYSDEGLPTGTGILSNIFAVPSTLSLSELNSGYTPEGVKYQRTTSLAGETWGVTLDDGDAGRSKNLSSYSGGNVKFNLRLARALGGGESIRIAVDDTTSSRGPVTLSATHGFLSSSTDWQEISIPLGSFTGAGLIITAVKVPFKITTIGVAPNLTFDVDAIRWEN